MKNQNVKELLPLNLQFFADSDSSGDSGDNGNDQGNNSNGQNGNDHQGSNGEPGEKTFTQEQVNSMMTKEKNEGKRSILKSLGFKNEEEALEAIKKYNEYQESKKTEEEKNADLLKKTSDEKNEALSRAKTAEYKLACFEAGINKDFIDDVFAIVSSKVTEEKSFEDVLKEMKAEEKYKNFFSNNSSSSGTGGNPGHSSNNGNDNKSYGKRLGADASKVKKEKSSFFDN